MVGKMVEIEVRSYTCVLEDGGLVHFTVKDKELTVTGYSLGPHYMGAVFIESARLKSFHKFAKVAYNKFIESVGDIGVKFI